MASTAVEFKAGLNIDSINSSLNQLAAGIEGAADRLNKKLGGTVSKSLVIDIKTDENGIKKLVAFERQRYTEASKLASLQKKLDIQSGSATSLRQQVNNFRQQRDQVRRYNEEIGASGGLIRRQTSEWTRLNDQLSESSRKLAIAEASGFWEKLKVTTRSQGFINVLNGLNQIVIGLQSANIVVGQFFSSINNLVGSLAEIQSFELTFTAIGQGAIGGVAALQEASRIALGLGVDLGTVQDGFRQLSPVVLNIGGTMGDVSAITETLSSRFAAFGISGDRARRVMNGVIQAFAKGKLQAEELTQQISEADPAFKTDFTKALYAARNELGSLGKKVDGTVANLEKLVKAGQITSDVLIKVLPGLSKSSLLFGKLGTSGASSIEALQKGSVTIDQVRTNLNNLNQLSLRNLAQSAQPFINTFLQAQSVVTDFFARISRGAGAEGLANLATGALKAFTGVADSLFLIAEGISSIAGLFNGVLGLFSQFPIISQIIGISILGNLLGPLKLFEQRVAKNKAVWANFSTSISDSLGSPRKQIDEISQSLKSLSKNAVIGRVVPEAMLDVNPNAGAQASLAKYQEIQNTLKKGISFDVGKPQALIDVENQFDSLLVKIVDIDNERQKLNASFGQKIPPGQFKAEEVAKYQEEITKVRDERARLRKELSDLIDSETNYTQIIQEGSQAGATFEQRQRAIGKALEFSGGVLENNAPKVEQLKNKLAGLLQEQERISSQPGPKPALGGNAQEIAATRRELVQLRAENIAAIRATKELQGIQASNAITADTLGAKFRRLGTGIRGGFAGALNLGRAALKSFGNGIASIIGLLDPLIIAFAAFGVVSRLYADGTKEATDAAKIYADQLAALNQASDQFLPGQRKQEQSLGSVTNAWNSLALVVAKAGNGIGAGLNNVTQSITTFVGQAQGVVPFLKTDLGRAIGVTAAAVGGLAAGFGLLALAGVEAGSGIGAIAVPATLAAAAAAFSIGVSADQASTKLETLYSKLKEVNNGVQGLADSAQGLGRGLLDAIPAGKAPTDQQLSRLSGGTQAVTTARNQLQQEYDTINGQIQANNELRKQQRQEQEKALSVAADYQRQLTEAERAGASENTLQPIRRLIAINQEAAKEAEKTSSQANNASAAYAVTLSRLKNELDQTIAIQDKLNARLKEQQRLAGLSANTIGELGNAIKTLQEDNQGFNLTDKGDLKKLDANLERIKQIQKVLEFVGKTKYEINLEVRGLQADIASAQTKINIEPGVIRDVQEIARTTQETVQTAGETLANDIRYYQTAIKQGEIEKSKGNEAIKAAGLTYLATTRAAAAELIDSGRKFRDQLDEAKSSLQNLKLSKPGFFTAGELKANAEQITKDFKDAVEKVRREQGDPTFTPKIEGDTYIERLKSQADFVQTRKEADKLTKSIQDISVVLDVIAQKLTGLSGKEIADLKKAGIDVNKTVDSASTKLDSADGSVGKIAKNIPRIGQITGKLSAGGQEMVLYFDNATKQVEQVTGAQFRALQAADKLAANGQKAGENIAKGADTASGAVSTLTSRVGEVVGRISAGGQEQILYYDKLTNQLESVNKATFNRLSKEKLISKENGKQLDKLDKATALFQNNKAQTPKPAKTNAPITGSFIYLPPKLISDAQGNQQIAELARSVGGDFTRVLEETIATGGVGSFPLGKLSSIQLAVNDYGIATQVASLAQDQLTEAQNRYNLAVSQGQQDITMLKISLENAKIAYNDANVELGKANDNLKLASGLAGKLGIDLESVPPLGEAFLPPDAEQSIERWGTLIKNLQEKPQQLMADPLKSAAQSATTLSEQGASASDALANGQAPAEGIAGSLGNAANSVSQISDNLQALDGKTFTVGINTSPAGRWAGGPVSAGTSYQVNEIGREGFLSAAGQLTAINRPANSIWRAPGSGTVIPAHIMNTLNIPQTGIRANARTMNVNPGDNGLQRVAKALVNGFTANTAQNSNVDELARVQASQAIQIGRLSQAVTKLADKNWDVNVNVRQNKTSGYLNALTRRI